MIGFLPQERIRTPVYTSSSEKVGYMYGEYFTSLDGILIARILKYKIELPAANACVSAVHVVTPELTHED